MVKCSYKVQVTRGRPAGGNKDAGAARINFQHCQLSIVKEVPMKKTIIFFAPATLALAGMLACGGGGDKKPVPATKLEYTDPTGTGYRFVKNATSTATKLVLDLKGPASGTGRGVSFSVTSDATKVSFVKVESSDREYAQNEAFDLGTGDYKLFKGVVDGNSLKVSVAQKGATASDKPLGGTLVRIALEMKTSANMSQNTTITFTASDARELPSSGGSQPITIAYGTLVAK